MFVSFLFLLGIQHFQCFFIFIFPFVLLLKVRLLIEFSGQMHGNKMKHNKYYLTIFHVLKIFILVK